MSELSPLAWVTGYTRREEGIVPNTYRAYYSLAELIKRELVDTVEAQTLLLNAGLEDFGWEMTWPEDFETPDEMLEINARNAHGWVIFIHGWTGNRHIWESLPGMVVTANRQLISLAIDHNGFGVSRFADHTPELEICNPPAAMTVLQAWVDLLRIRRQPGTPTPKVVNFVGHSMGGATLFYLNPILWRLGEETRYALAPALLLDDELYRVFFTTLGIGIGLLERIRGLGFIEQALKPTVIRTLCEGASERVKAVHSEQYEETPRGITGATFMAMGRLKNREIAHHFELFRVMLGHRDRLVGLHGMMDLLAQLEFPVANMRVVQGSHYMFSVGNESMSNAFLHAQARELVVQDILELHTKAFDIQRKGKRVG